MVDSEDEAAAVQERERIEAELAVTVPVDFIAARDAAAAAARLAGNRQLATHLKALRRPTVSAWLVNALVRDDREVVDSFLELGQALALAQSTLQGAELRALSSQRSQLVTSLVHRAEVLGRRLGVRVDSATAGEVQDTLLAALADPAAAEAVRAGRLTRPLTYAGFGLPMSPEEATARRSKPAKPAEVTPTADDKAKLAAREHAEKRRQAIDDAERSLASADQADAAARIAVAEAEAEVQHAREALHDAERRAAEATLEGRRAAAALRRARTSAQAARDAP